MTSYRCLVISCQMVIHFPFYCLSFQFSPLASLLYFSFLSSSRPSPLHSLSQVLRGFICMCFIFTKILQAVSFALRPLHGLQLQSHALLQACHYRSASEKANSPYGMFQDLT